jgi:hypothetical protein
MKSTLCSFTRLFSQNYFGYFWLTFYSLDNLDNCVCVCVCVCVREREREIVGIKARAIPQPFCFVFCLKDRVSLTFPRPPQTHDSHVSTSEESEIIDINHHTRLHQVNFYKKTNVCLIGIVVGIDHFGKTNILAILNFHIHEHSITV